MIRATQRGAKQPDCYYCLFGTNNIIFHCFRFNVLFDMLRKGMVESSILSKDEPLTPNIDKLMAV